MALRFDSSVTLVGAGAVSPADIDEVLSPSNVVVAADGGAMHVIAAGRVPDAVIGDFDSLPMEIRRRLDGESLFEVSDQDTTDFEKCLERIDAPLILAIGFAGRRLDHQLAVYNALVRYPHRRCIVLGDEDLVFHAPDQLDLDLPTGTRLSLFPMVAMRGRSDGLRWPIGEIAFAPDGRVGTSNLVTGPVRLGFDVPGMLVILPRTTLADVTRALAPG